MDNVPNRKMTLAQMLNPEVLADPSEAPPPPRRRLSLAEMLRESPLTGAHIPLAEAVERARPTQPAAPKPTPAPEAGAADDGAQANPQAQSLISPAESSASADTFGSGNLPSSGNVLVGDNPSLGGNSSSFSNSSSAPVHFARNAEKQSRDEATQTPGDWRPSFSTHAAPSAPAMPARGRQAAAENRYHLYARLDGRWTWQCDVRAASHGEAFRQAIACLRPEHDSLPIRLEQDETTVLAG